MLKTVSKTWNALPDDVTSFSLNTSTPFATSSKRDFSISLFRKFRTSSSGSCWLHLDVQLTLVCSNFETVLPFKVYTTCILTGTVGRGGATHGEQLHEITGGESSTSCDPFLCKAALNTKSRKLPSLWGLCSTPHFFEKNTYCINLYFWIWLSWWLFSAIFATQPKKPYVYVHRESKKETLYSC